MSRRKTRRVEREFSKNDIFACVMDYGHYQKYIPLKESNPNADKLDIEKDKEVYIKKLDKRLNVITKFLNREDIIKILERRTENDQGNFFYNEEMNLTRAKGKAYEAYNYNYIDVIFLGVLISLFDHPSFSAIRNKPKEVNPDQDKEWIEAFRKELDSFASFGVKHTGKEYRFEPSGKKIRGEDRWAAVKFSIENLLYRFTLLNLAENAIEIREKLDNMRDIFTGLPDYVQIEIYEDGMKSRIAYIEDIIIRHVEALVQEEMDGEESGKNEKNKNGTNEFKHPSHQFYRRLSEIDESLDNEYIKKLSLEDIIDDL